MRCIRGVCMCGCVRLGVAGGSQYTTSCEPPCGLAVLLGRPVPHQSWNRYLKHYTTLSYINVLATCSRWLSYTTLDTRVWRFLWAREVVVHHFDEQPAVRLIWPARYNLFVCVMVVYSARWRGGRGLAYILYVCVREQVHLTQCWDFLVTEARAISKLWNWLFKHHTTPFWATCIYIS